MSLIEATETATGHRGGGKLAVLAMIAVALVAATFAWWWNFNRGRKALAFFGPTAARLIRTAPKVEILVVGGPESTGGPDSTDDKVLIGSGQFAVYRRIDISKAPGLVHARTSLLMDSSYSGGIKMTARGYYTEIVRFADDDGEVFLAFTETEGDLHFVSEVTAMRLIPKTANGWWQFIERHVKNAQATTPSATATPPEPARMAPSE
jgi:hypothetical protein